MRLYRGARRAEIDHRLKAEQLRRSSAVTVTPPSVAPASAVVPVVSAEP